MAGGDLRVAVRAVNEVERGIAALNETLGPQYFLLDESHQPVRTPFDLWLHRFDDKARVVQQDQLRGGVLVSTVFLGMDHGRHWMRGADAQPILFETMVFGDPDFDEFQVRYATWDDALRGHAVVLGHVREPSWSRWLCRVFHRIVGKPSDTIYSATETWSAW